MSITANCFFVIDPMSSTNTKFSTRMQCVRKRPSINWIVASLESLGKDYQKQLVKANKHVIHAMIYLSSPISHKGKIIFTDDNRQFSQCSHNPI